MKKYTNPEVMFNVMTSEDIITTSGQPVVEKTGYSVSGAGNEAISIEDLMLN